ncbi:hypothetical protein LguiA_008975 [Lonicera macranthoides]
MPPNKFSYPIMPSAKTLVSTAASIAASGMVIRSLARDLVPRELRQHVLFKIQTLVKSFSPYIVLIIEEFTGLVSNQIYKAVEFYLGSKISPNTKILKVTMPEKENSLVITMAKNQETVDTFNGVQFTWKQIGKKGEDKRTVYQGQSTSIQQETKYFHLTFHKKHMEMVFNSYFPFILSESKRLREEKKTLKIRTLNGDDMRRYSRGDHTWNSVSLDHPSTFETLAMDDDLKKEIIEDLETFVKRKEFYRRVGKAWKRGYLLYGPPGTGKSSLIAAMANYLKFDIYDLELTDIRENSELRRLLIGTANRSILVVEDIDCSLNLDDERKEEGRVLKALKSSQGNQAQTVNIVRKEKEKRVTLSGLLNFIDGLWSSCGDERIIIFTTNHKERLDPALLRPGRMDMHIHMSYCMPGAFKTLALNYLGMTDHPLFLEVKSLLAKTTVTPAEVAEQLLKKVDPEAALGGLIVFLGEKKREREEMEARMLKEEQEKEEIQTQNSVEQTVVVD